MVVCQPKNAEHFFGTLFSQKGRTVDRVSMILEVAHCLGGAFLVVRQPKNAEHCSEGHSWLCIIPKMSNFVQSGRNTVGCSLLGRGIFGCLSTQKCQTFFWYFVLPKMSNNVQSGRNTVGHSLLGKGIFGRLSTQKCRAFFWYFVLPKMSNNVQSGRNTVGCSLLGKGIFGRLSTQKCRAFFGTLFSQKFRTMYSRVGIL